MNFAQKDSRAVLDLDCQNDLALNSSTGKCQGVDLGANSRTSIYKGGRIHRKVASLVFKSTTLELTMFLSVPESLDSHIFQKTFSRFQGVNDR